MATLKKLPPFNAAIIFCSFTVYFYLLLFILFPLLKTNFSFHPAVYWFITGYLLFIPLFAFAVFKVKSEGNRQILQALNLKKLSKTDWRYALIGTFLSFVFTGLIFGASMLLHKYFGTGMLNTTPWFMEMRAFIGWEKLLLLVWLPMFFFNIVGEEILWRGYIQTRMEGRFAWLICSLLWAVFHIPFGIDLIIMASPVLLLIPYIFSKTGNTTIGIFIHGIYNGPIFILISLGVIH